MIYYNLLIFIASLAFVIGDDYFLEFPLGKIRGKTRTTITGVTLYSFQGIPFAEPPLNEFRFRAAQAKQPWSGVMDATDERSICLQMVSEAVNGNEDCLFINIFSPKDPKLNSSLPVMVFIYGGGFVEGASWDANIGPDYLMDHDVVYVTFNYRVGPFGFFSTGDDVAPGNAGLKDQLLAIKFVNQYIQHFGGDPKKITIFGQSAGGASAHYHVLSPKSKGLFRAAILESGSSLSAWASQRNQTEISYLLAKIINPEFGTYNASSTEIYKYLRGLPTEAIHKASYVIHNMEKPTDRQMIRGFYFAPVIEHDHEDAFLTKPMFELLKRGEFNTVPVIMGVNSEESLFNVQDLWFNYTADTFENDNSLLIPRSLNARESDRAVIGKKIKDFYCPYWSFSTNWRSLIKYFSDQSFARSLIKTAELQSKWSDVYFYEFQFHGVLGGFVEESVIGFSEDIRHGEEISFILRRNYGGLNTTDLSKYPEIDQLVQKRFIKMFTNFAKYLDPTPNQIDLLQNITWPKVKPDDFQYMAIGSWLEVKQNPKEDMYTFWEQIFSAYGVEPFSSY